MVELLIIGQVYVYFYKQLSDFFQSGWKPQFPATMYDNSSCSTSLPTFSVVDLLNFGSCTECRAVTYCILNLHFPGDSWYWTLFSGLTGHLYVYFCEVSVQIFCPFLEFSGLSLWVLRFLMYWVSILFQINVL